MIRLNDILERVNTYRPEADLDLIKKAYVYSAKVHQGQIRKSGEPYLIHPLEDAGLLADYLGGLCDHTRSLWRPHPFDPETAAAICAALDPSDILRVVGTVSRDGQERLVAYFLLHLGARESDQRRYAGRGIPLDPAADAAFAPSVADDYQDQGVGSLVKLSDRTHSRRTLA